MRSQMRGGQKPQKLKFLNQRPRSLWQRLLISLRPCMLRQSLLQQLLPQQRPGSSHAETAAEAAIRAQGRHRLLNLLVEFCELIMNIVIFYLLFPIKYAYNS